MERDCESELSKLNIEQNACIYHFGASVIHGQRSNILRLPNNCDSFCFTVHNCFPPWQKINTQKKMSFRCQHYHQVTEKKVTLSKSAESNHIFFHPDYTVGFGITPNRAFYARGLYRQSGISPCPEDTFIQLFVLNYNISCFLQQLAEESLILSILVYTFFSRMFDLMLPPVAKHSIVVA